MAYSLVWLERPDACREGRPARLTSVRRGFDSDILYDCLPKLLRWKVFYCRYVLECYFSFDQVGRCNQSVINRLKMN